jgi:hypothetical protein
MRRIELSRRDLDGLLGPPSDPGHQLPDGWAGLLVDPVEQLKELADLRARGLLSAEEFEGQKAKVMGWD